MFSIYIYIYIYIYQTIIKKNSYFTLLKFDHPSNLRDDLKTKNYKNKYLK